MSSLTIRLTPHARNDLARSKNFLDALEPGLAETVLRRILKALRRLLVYPCSALVVDGENGIRELFIAHGASGYAARYIIEEPWIIVLAVRHQREATNTDSPPASS